ncbi:hypothetical protein PIROE2DRAFT_4013 [Piromyces sp. E2]|nr:hypothetical protein PIROE2DRAFT_4013 [Piromyces sp. E2]|eukprot:OUM68273.1 hypothetical protein PIROE2DRAFT_4013 [Piromyces sp. E2]
MSEISRKHRLIRETFSPNISINSDSILSCCVKDLSLEIKNKDGNNENIKTGKKRPTSPTKINISIDNDSNTGSKNQLNDSSTKLNGKLNDDKRIYFSILLPKEYRESKNCKIQLSMDMNICLDDTPEQKPVVNKSPIIQSRDSLPNSSSNSKSSSKSSSRSGLNRKSRIKKNIIDNLNTNESINPSRSTGNNNRPGSIQRVTSNGSSRKTSISSNRSSSRVQNNSSQDSSKKNSLDKVNRNSSSNGFKKIRQLKNDIDQIDQAFEENSQRRKTSDSSKNSIDSNSRQSSHSSSANTLQLLFGSKNSMSGKPPLANSTRSSSILKNLQSQDSIKDISSISKSNSDVIKTEESLNENDMIIQNLYLPKDSNRMKYIK